MTRRSRERLQQNGLAISPSVIEINRELRRLRKIAGVRPAKPKIGSLSVEVVPFRYVYLPKRNELPVLEIGILLIGGTLVLRLHLGYQFVPYSPDAKINMNITYHTMKIVLKDTPV